MTTRPEPDSIAPHSLAHDPSWCDEVQEFWVSPDSENLRDCQQDGAAAIIDLASQYGGGRGTDNRALVARTIGRLSDIQVRDFALGSHTAQTSEFYWQMWRDLLQVAPRGFVAPIACLYASMAYERGDTERAHCALDRAIEDDLGYSLALLLRRVFVAGWPRESFSAMRSELHPKVVAGIFS